MNKFIEKQIDSSNGKKYSITNNISLGDAYDQLYK